MTLDDFRRLRRLSFPQLAELLGLSGSNPARTAQRWCAFERLPDMAGLKAIAEATRGLVGPADFPDHPTVPRRRRAARSPSAAA